MSRTYKDTPEWVQTSREKRHAQWHHNHWLIGRAIKKTVHKTDPTGNPLYQLTSWTSYITETWAYEGKQYYTSKPVTQYGWVPVYETVTTQQYKNYCTCGIEPDPKDTSGLRNPCVKYITNKTRWYKKQTLKNNHPGGRHQARETLNQAVKAYNTDPANLTDTDQYETVHNTKPPKEWVW